MAQTVLSSKTRTIVIGPEQPFTIIGERINPTGRKRLAAEMAAGDYSRVINDALAQVEAGAHALDINAGIPLADEPAILAETVRIVQSITDAPLSIDSSIVAALERGLAAYEGKALVNSVTGEDERLESVLPLVKKYGAAVIGISNDQTGISEDPDVRFSVAKKIVERAMDHGIPAHDVLIDPLVMPIGAAPPGRTPGICHHPPRAGRAGLQYRMRSEQCLLRFAKSPDTERHFLADGNCLRADRRHYQPVRDRDPPGTAGC